MHEKLRWIYNLSENWVPGSLSNSTFRCLYFRVDNFSCDGWVVSKVNVHVGLIPGCHMYIRLVHNWKLKFSCIYWKSPSQVFANWHVREVINSFNLSNNGDVVFPWSGPFVWTEVIIGSKFGYLPANMGFCAWTANQGCPSIAYFKKNWRFWVKGWCKLTYFPSLWCVLSQLFKQYQILALLIR